MNLFLGGDFAWPHLDIIAQPALEALVADGKLLVNLEGGIITGPAEESEVANDFKFNLYSSKAAVAMLQRLNTIACSLANNHVSDYLEAVETSKTVLAEQGIAVCGTHDIPSCTFEMDGRKFIVFGACSPLPEPRVDQRADHAMIFKPAAALAHLRDLRQRHPDATLIAFMHWGYELALYPQPADREWARQAIDAGVDLVIGHHPHVVQGLERHGKGIIAYSLGNLLLPQVAYRGRKLHYKTNAVCEELLLELAPEGLRAHWLRYDIKQLQLVVEGSGLAEQDARLGQRTPFRGMSDSEYRTWFDQEGKFATEGKRPPLVFWGYRNWRGIDTSVKFSYLATRRTIRKLAISAGIHKPYNW